MPFPIPIRPGQIPADVGPPLLGPAADDLVPLPYPSLAQQGTARWVLVNEWRTYGAGKKEPVWNGEVTRAYRCRFTAGYPYLERDIAEQVIRALTDCNTLFYAPYSDADGSPSPDVFEVNSLGEIPDESDLITGRAPLALDLETVHVWRTCGDDIPVRGVPPNIAPTFTPAGMRIIVFGAPSGENEWPPDFTPQGMNIVSA